MLTVYTAQYNYKGPNRADITVKTAKPPWDVFAPTWDMVNKYRYSKKDFAAEENYRDKYERIVQKAIDTHYALLIKLLYSDETRVLVCFCKPGDFCHRVLLARYLESLGANYKGEI